MAMIPHERSLVTKYKDRPFALIGVECYDKRAAAKKFAEKKKINWRSFLDEKGNIANAWGVNGFPTIYLIDHEGVIREVDPWGKELDDAIERLVKKAEKSGGESKQTEEVAVPAKKKRSDNGDTAPAGLFADFDKTTK